MERKRERKARRKEELSSLMRGLCTESELRDYEWWRGKLFPAAGFTRQRKHDNEQVMQRTKKKEAKIKGNVDVCFLQSEE